MTGFYVLIAVVAIIAAFIGWYNSEAQRTRRALRATPLVSIREAPVGALIKLQGRARAHRKVLIAPLSKRRCVFWEVLVEERRSSGKSSSWSTILEKRRGRSFFLDDGDDRALINADGNCQLALEVDTRYSAGTFSDAPSHVVDWIEKQGRTTTGWLGFRKHMRYREAVIELKEVVVVQGVGRREPDPDPEAVTGYRNKAQRLVVDAPADGALLLSDDPSLVT